MSRTRIVKGIYTKISGGGHSMYSKGSINSFADNQITENGLDNGLLYTDPKSPPKNKKVYDIVMFVAGTTDPINTSPEKHQANTDYWRGKIKKEDKDSMTNFFAKVMELHPQYNNLHIEGNFFSWSGDNNTEERNLAAESLLDVILRTYIYWRNYEVHLHLIGHSHGGNVINQFTKLITSKEMIAKSIKLSKNKFTAFPKLWDIKSITYLSTPFFQKKHQLNHTKLNKDCKIINVHNEYDLTQQLVADFTLVNLEEFLRDFHMDKFQKGLDTLGLVNIDAFRVLYHVYIEDKREGPLLWGETAKGLLGINQFTQEFITYIKGINFNKPSLDKDRDEFVTILNSFLHWTYTTYNIFYKNRTNREGGYGRTEYFDDLNLSSGLTYLNKLFDIKTNVKDSYILMLLARLFAANSGLTDSIEITSSSPIKQAQGLSIQDVNITTFDKYNLRKKKPIFKKFLKDTTNALQRNNLEEVLMRLFSQFVKPDMVTVIYIKMQVLEHFGSKEYKGEVEKLRKSLGVYLILIRNYHAELVTKKDEKEIKDLMKRPGTIPYLAIVSHSLSHTQLWKEVKDGLKGAFMSGVNPGYGKK